ncbi:hypothetical protein [Streptomyces corynorhini]|uniref:Phage gp6-like head-tail connector protein n=1 Tax=Streptomyces corynorhini TaxID=2282652 RepID=A0A370BC51_9ACTN|nr:hypothetical protein [Streptomyces corynorhini]RDG37959.1 hypothetical protein DVH02_11590 [Streptomyces corynorhini]
MDPLATPADLEARLGRQLIEEESARSAALLADASALVRDFTRRHFTPVTDDVIVLRPVGVQLRLPQRPVTAVSAVKAVRGDGVATAGMTGWVWDGIDKVDLSGAAYGIDGTRLDTWGRGSPDTYQVTYSHGVLPVPEAVVATVCAMVLRTLLAPSMSSGVAGERIGQYSYQIQPGTSATGATVTLSGADEKALARWGPRRFGTIQLRVG